MGPAGRELDRARAEAGIEGTDVSLTNAVKHFRFVERGRRRIHKTPAVGQVVACDPWLDAELAAVRPRVAVALGTTAARTLLGRGVSVRTVRGRRFDDPGGLTVVVTTHPSAVVRLRRREG